MLDTLFVLFEFFSHQEKAHKLLKKICGILFLYKVDITKTNVLAAW